MVGKGGLMRIWLCLGRQCVGKSVLIEGISRPTFSEARACIRPPGVASKSAGLPLWADIETLAGLSPSTSLIQAHGAPLTLTRLSPLDQSTHPPRAHFWPLVSAAKMGSYDGVVFGLRQWSQLPRSTWRGYRGPSRARSGGVIASMGRVRGGCGVKVAIRGVD
jgi:hypothetical protein